MTDLFSLETRQQPVQILAPYPSGPGAQRTDTSREGAAFIAPKVATLKARVLSAIRSAGDFGATTDELCAALQLPRVNVQPRTSDLRNDELIFDSGRRRKNSSGLSAIVWTAVRPAAMAEAA
jgi:hypothetical protein